MKSILLKIIVIVIISQFFGSCRSLDLPNGWKEIHLPTGFSFGIPHNFVNKGGIGIDSYVGTIKSDSFLLRYDGHEAEFSSLNTNCDFNTATIRSQMSIDTGFWKEHYKIPELHYGYLDTLDGRIAIIIRPRKAGYGNVHFIMGICESDAWLSISGENLTLEQEEIALKIFKTIRYRK